jgi:hypothetical protein
MKQEGQSSSSKEGSTGNGAPQVSFPPSAPSGLLPPVSCLLPPCLPASLPSASCLPPSPSYPIPHTPIAQGLKGGGQDPQCGCPRDCNVAREGTYTHTYTHTHTLIHPYSYSYTHTHTLIHSYTHTHTLIHSYTHSHTNTLIHSYSYTHTPILIHSYTHTHTHTHTLVKVPLFIAERWVRSSNDDCLGHLKVSMKSSGSNQPPTRQLNIELDPR